MLGSPAPRARCSSARRSAACACCHSPLIRRAFAVSIQIIAKRSFRNASLPSAGWMPCAASTARFVRDSDSSLDCGVQRRASRSASRKAGEWQKRERITLFFCAPRVRRLSSAISAFARRRSVAFAFSKVASSANVLRSGARFSAGARSPSIPAARARQAGQTARCEAIASTSGRPPSQARRISSLVRCAISAIAIARERSRPFSLTQNTSTCTLWRKGGTWGSPHEGLPRSEKDR
jgi:hypothetical protein